MFPFFITPFCSIEEKIYQRQIMKGDVASAVSRSGASACHEDEDADEREGGDDAWATSMTMKSNGHFTTEELKDLFTLSTVRLGTVHSAQLVSVFLWNFMTVRWIYCVVSGHCMLHSGESQADSIKACRTVEGAG